MKGIRIDSDYVVDWITNTQDCHGGIPLSNGIFGALIWFRGNTLMVTVNRADYWDHRGGLVWNEACSFEHLRALLEAGAYKEAQDLFQIGRINGQEKKPTRLPMGRYEIRLKDGLQIVSARLDLLHAQAYVVCQYGNEQVEIKASVMMDRPALALSVQARWVKSVVPQPAYSFPEVKAYFDAFDIPSPRLIAGETVVGWVQELPDDPACAVLAAADAENGLLIGSVYGETAALAIEQAKSQLEEWKGLPYARHAGLTAQVWSELWERTADIAMADRDMETMYYLGIYKMLGNAMPGGVAPTLQGPWVEEHRMPPWSGDYHFNINVQECLWPAYASNHLACLEPLFRMIDRWKPDLAERAYRFTGEQDGYQMVHACDDRGQAIGKFWTGIIDHANTSWLCQMMWQYALYAQDRAFMLDEVYPFMKKTLNVFIRMMTFDETACSLPVSVSPEYGGAGANAWGRNSTFFLVNIHYLCDKIVFVAEEHGIDSAYTEKVREIQARLPKLTTGNGLRGEEIHLWEGQPLAESHRHHSHLAGIYPFATMHPEEPQYQEILRNSYETWIARGMGRWTGWSMTWASLLHGRFGGKEMAWHCLKLLQDVFTRPGFATSHNAVYPGFSVHAGGDVMQTDAAISASAAILELFLQCVQGEIRVFPTLPDRFRNASFSGIRAEGAFLVSAERRNGVVTQVQVYSEAGGVLRLRNPCAGRVRVEYRGVVNEADAPILQLATEAGESMAIRDAGR